MYSIHGWGIVPITQCCLASLQTPILHVCSLQHPDRHITIDLGHIHPLMNDHFGCSHPPNPPVRVPRGPHTGGVDRCLAAIGLPMAVSSPSVGPFGESKGFRWRTSEYSFPFSRVLQFRALFSLLCEPSEPLHTQEPSPRPHRHSSDSLAPPPLSSASFGRSWVRTKDVPKWRDEGRVVWTSHN